MATFTSSLLIKLIDQASAPAKAIAKSLDALRDAQRRNNLALAEARSRMIDATVMGVGLYQALVAPTKAAMEFESKLEDIAQKVDVPVSALGELGKELKAVARDTNQTASEMAKGMDVLAGMGANRADSLALLKPIGRTATAYNASISDLSRAGYAALDNLKVPADQFGAALDAMAQAGKAGAFELKDMARYFPALTSGYQALGQKGVPAVADLSAALQIVRKGASDSSSAATNLANILQKMNSPLTRKNFAKMGVDLEKELKKAAEKGMTPIEAITEITNRTIKGDMSKLGDLFNDAQVQEGLRPLLQNLQLYREIRAQAMGAQGVVEEDYQRRQKTAAAAVMRFKAAIESVQLAIGSALLPVLADFATALVPIINSIGDFIEKNPGLTRAIILTTSAIIGLRVAMIAGRYGWLLFRGGLLSATGGLLGFTRLAGAGMMAPLRLGLKSLISPIGLVTKAFWVLKVAMISSFVGAIFVAIAMAGLWIYNNWDGVSSAFIAFKDAFVAALGPVMPFLQPLIDGVKWLWQWLCDLVGPIDASKENWAQWGAVIGKVVGGALKNIVSFIRGVFRFFGKIIAYFTGLWKRVAASGAGGIRILSDEIWKGLGLIIKSFAKLPGRILRAIGNTELAKSLGIDGALNALADFYDHVGEYISYAFDKISEFRTALLDKVGEFYEIGKELIYKLWDGIKEIMSQLKDYLANCISEMVSNAYAKLKGLLSYFRGGSSGEQAAEATQPSGAPNSAPQPIDGARAEGGPVKVGRTYLVGERGPELFTAPNDGIIHNHNKTRELFRNRLNIHAPITTAPAAAINGRFANAPLANSVGFSALANWSNAVVQLLGSLKTTLSKDIIVRSPINISLPDIPTGNTQKQPALSGRSATINLGGITINVPQSNNLDAKALAQKVAQIVGQEIQKSATAAFSDGVY